MSPSPYLREKSLAQYYTRGFASTLYYNARRKLWELTILDLRSDWGFPASLRPVRTAAFQDKRATQSLSIPPHITIAPLHLSSHLFFHQLDFAHYLYVNTYNTLLQQQ